MSFLEFSLKIFNFIVLSNTILTNRALFGTSNMFENKNSHLEVHIAKFNMIAGCRWKVFDGFKAISISSLQQNLL